MAADSPAQGVVQIWIVDDEPEDLDLLRMHLAKAPFAHVCTPMVGGQDCLDRLAAGERPDLLVLDLNMPGVDGHMTLKHIREHLDKRECRVMAFTTSSQDADIVAMFEGGANAFVTKPSDVAGYHAVIDQMHDFIQAYIWKGETPPARTEMSRKQA